MAEPLLRRKMFGGKRKASGGERKSQQAGRSPPLGAWISASDNPALAHAAVLRLTYGITPAVVAMAVLARLLGMAIPVWLIAALGTVMVTAARHQDRMIQRGRFAGWMPATHLNLGLVLLTVWVAFSGGVQSPFVWIFGIAVAVYGTLWGIRWGTATATLSSVYLLAATALTAWLRVAPPGEPNVLAPLHASLVSYIALFFLVAFVSAALRGQVREIFREAQTDELTGLLNRRALREVLDSQIDRAATHGIPCAIAELEIDHFKQINDRFGHLQGDVALSRTAAILRRICRATDSLARYGGDEFVIVLPQATSVEAQTVLQRVQQAVAADPILRRFGLTLSAGLAAFPDRNPTSRGLLEAADRAMYLVKRRGGNSIAVA